MKNKIKIAIIGASGYTGIELIRLLLNHCKIEIKALIANDNAGCELGNIYSHLNNFDLPKLVKLDEVNFADIDLAFCCLPHTASQKIIKSLLNNDNYSHLKIIDLSADFRLQDVNAYKYWYDKEHIAADLQSNAIYGLSEFARDKIKQASKSNSITNSIIACPGCYPTSILLPLLPLIENKIIKTENIIIDSKSAISGAGRSLKLGNLYCESANSVKAYSICNHRHIAEIEQELAIAAKQEIQVNFTPHLIAMKRGIISTIYADLNDNFDLNAVKNCLETKYNDEYFVNLVEESPATSDVYGTNFCKIAAFKARQKGKVVLISVIDNLVKGASGQAVQNMNIAYGFDEREGLLNFPVYP